jgi:hypothetical protein
VPPAGLACYERAGACRGMQRRAGVPLACRGVPQACRGVPQACRGVLLACRGVPLACRGVLQVGKSKPSACICRNFEETLCCGNRALSDSTSEL